jgi:hypothetical protein
MSSPHASPDAQGSGGGRRRVLLVLLAVLLLLGVVTAALALPGEEQESSEPRREAAQSGAGDVVVPTRVVRVAGERRPAAQRRLVKQVRALVEEYVDDAYVERRRAFPGFTDKARRLARRDADVTTGRRLGGGDVVLRSGWARVSVLSPRPRNPLGATAAVRLELAAEGGSPTRSTVTGQLLLTPSARGWRVFGYDLAMSDTRGRLDATTEDGGTAR